MRHSKPDEFDWSYEEPEEDPRTAQHILGWLLLAVCIGFALLLSRFDSLEDSNGSILVVLLPLSVWMIRTKRILF